MTFRPVPESVLDAVARDLRAVRPLLPAGRRITAAATLSILALTALLALSGTGLRPDFAELPGWLSWGCSTLELAAGLLLLALALRESVPGGAVPTGLAVTTLISASGLQLLVGVVSWLHGPGSWAVPEGLQVGVLCLRRDLTLVLPVLAVSGWFMLRALPLRAPLAGALSGGGAAITGDAITHLLCPASDLAHILIWHTGAVIAIAVLGWVAGRVWQWARWR